MDSTEKPLQRPSEELDALKRLVADALRSQGVYEKLQAELRTAVFTAMQNEEARTSTTRQVTAAQRLAAAPGPAGLAVPLVLDLLETLQLDQTRSVMVPEAGIAGTALGRALPAASRSELARQLGLDNVTAGEPLLVTLLTRGVQSFPAEAENAAGGFSSPSSSVLQSPRSSPTASPVPPALRGRLGDDIRHEPVPAGLHGALFQNSF